MAGHRRKKRKHRRHKKAYVAYGGKKKTYSNLGVQFAIHPPGSDEHWAQQQGIYDPHAPVPISGAGHYRRRRR